MEVELTEIEGVVLIKPDVFGDPRGYFMETYQQRRYAEHGVDAGFVQDNISQSPRGVLRGLHWQSPHEQGKLVSVLVGEVFDVAVDIRPDSPTFGKWTGHYLSGENHFQLWVPPGLAHGFCVTSEQALFSYKCTDYYNPQSEKCIRWDDPTLNINWPVDNVVVSEKDRNGMSFLDVARQSGIPSS